jgi:2-polyprenyl-3-methyl-5-hydroxy-6-metoxy-1,4-benzoquinol methylase
MRYCKSLELYDYSTSDNFDHIRNIRNILTGKNLPCPFGHEHRTWEYGMALSALRENRTRTVLDVGGGASPFAVAAIWTGMEVLQLDPGHWQEAIQAQSLGLNMELPFTNIDFMDFPKKHKYDAVTCISVIEHIPPPQDEPFFLKLLSHIRPGGMLFLTTDFHPSGKGVFDGHERTFNAESMLRLIELGEEHGFSVWGDQPDYHHFMPVIFDKYSFAALALRKHEARTVR